MDYNALWQQRKDAGYTDAEIEEELAAQYFGTVMAEKYMQEQAAKADAGMFQKVIEHLKALLEDIRDRIEKVFGGDKVVKAALTEDADVLQYMINSFESTLDAVLAERNGTEAAETAETAETTGTTEKETEQTTERKFNPLDMVEDFDAKPSADIAEQSAYSRALDNSKATIDRYTEKQYNDYGWISVNHVLTGKELKKLYSQFADRELLNSNYAKTPDGYYMIPVGDGYDSYDKIVFIKGINKHPIISKVYEFVNNNCTKQARSEFIQEVMYYETNGIRNAFRVVENYAGEELFVQHTLQDYATYSQQRKTADGGQSNQNSEKRENGRGSVGTDTETVKHSRALDAAFEAWANDSDEVKYSRSLTGTEWYEQTRDLMAVHSTTAEKLAQALQWTGLPAPSIAVMKNALGNDMYGPISLIFDKRTIDPEADRRNHIYGSDAWTPTASNARVKYELDTDKAYALEKEIEALGGKVADGVFASASALGMAGVRGDTSVNSAKEIAQTIAGYDAVKAAYAAAHGIDVEPVRRTKEYDRHGNALLKYYINTMGKNVLQEYHEKIEQNALNEEDVDLLRQIYAYGRVEQFGEKWIAEHGGRERVEKAYLARAEHMEKYQLEKIVENAWTYWNETADANGEAGDEIDKLATLAKLDEQIDRKAVESWIENKLNDVIIGEGVSNGISQYTQMGNRRRFAQTHVPVTAENIVKEMFRNRVDRGAAHFPSAFGLQAAVSPEYKTINEVKKDKGKLRRTTEQERNEEINNLNGWITDVLTVISNKKSGFNSYADAGAAMLEAGRGGKYTAEQVKKTFAEYGFDISDGIAEDITAIYDDAANIATEYFEAKPARVVTWDEIKKVVMPTDTPVEIKEELAKYGIPIEEYEPYDEDQRREIMNAQDELKFSRALNQNAVEYVERLKGGSRQQWEKIDLLQDIADGTYVMAGPRLGDADLKKIARNFIATRLGRGGNAGNYSYAKTEDGLALRNEDLNLDFYVH